MLLQQCVGIEYECKHQERGGHAAGVVQRSVYAEGRQRGDAAIPPPKGRGYQDEEQAWADGAVHGCVQPRQGGHRYAQVSSVPQKEEFLEILVGERGRRSCVFCDGDILSKNSCDILAFFVFFSPMLEWPATFWSDGMVGVRC